MRWHSEENPATKGHIKIRNQNDFQVFQNFSQVIQGYYPSISFLLQISKKKIAFDSNFCRTFYYVMPMEY